MGNTILALDASEWQGRLSRQHLQYAYDMGVRLYIAQLFGSGPTGLGPNDYADEQLGFAKDVGMALAGYIWVPPDNTLETEKLVQVSLDAAGPFTDELRFVAPDLEGGRLHPTNPVGRLMNVCENLVFANKHIIIYNRANNWVTVMGGDAEEFKQWALWEARYLFKSGYRPDMPPDIDWAWSPYGGWTKRAILQYAGTAPVQGWSADWNVVALDRLGFDLFVDMPDPTPPTPPKPSIPTPPPAPKPELPAGTGEYTVRATDTDGLSGIASRELKDANRWPEIAALNPSVSPPRYVIHEGDVLLLPTKAHTPPAPPKSKPTPPTPAPRRPATRQYKVKSSDGAEGLSGIAMRELGDASRWPEIAELNGFKPPYTIHAKQIILLPGQKGSPSRPPSPPPRPSTPTHRVGSEGANGLWGIWEARGRPMTWVTWYPVTCDLNGWPRGSSPTQHQGKTIKVAA